MGGELSAPQKLHAQELKRIFKEHTKMMGKESKVTLRDIESLVGEIGRLCPWYKGSLTNEDWNRIGTILHSPPRAAIQHLLLHKQLQEAIQAFNAPFKAPHLSASLLLPLSDDPSPYSSIQIALPKPTHSVESLLLPPISPPPLSSVRAGFKEAQSKGIISGEEIADVLQAFPVTQGVDTQGQAVYNWEPVPLISLIPDKNFLLPSSDIQLVLPAAETTLQIAKCNSSKAVEAFPLLLLSEAPKLDSKIISSPVLFCQEEDESYLEKSGNEAEIVSSFQAEIAACEKNSEMPSSPVLLCPPLPEIAISNVNGQWEGQEEGMSLENLETSSETVLALPIMFAEANLKTGTIACEENSEIPPAGLTEPLAICPVQNLKNGGQIIVTLSPLPEIAFKKSDSRGNEGSHVKDNFFLQGQKTQSDSLSFTQIKTSVRAIHSSMGDELSLPAFENAGQLKKQQREGDGTKLANFATKFFAQVKANLGKIQSMANFFPVNLAGLILSFHDDGG